MRKIPFWLLPLTTCAMLTACATNPANEPSQSVIQTDPTAELQAYHWQISKVTGANGADQSGTWSIPAQKARPWQLTFNEGGTLSVQNLCNIINASYQVDGEKIKIGPGASTLRACQDKRLMELERRIANTISQATTWQIDQKTNAQNQKAPILQLRFADSSTWNLTGYPTDATRYGSAPERIFLEVAPEQVACNNPLMPDARCLQVRTIEYSESGVKRTQGEWQVFNGSIDGFAFEPGIRNVLRLNRYTLQNPPADASAHVYVLDMRVESERVR